VQALAEVFDLTGLPELAPPRYNIAPTQPVLAVRAAASGSEAVWLRRGLVAPWAKDTKQAPINARSETAADKQPPEPPEAGQLWRSAARRGGKSEVTDAPAARADGL
jgi:hypothetical protein